MRAGCARTHYADPAPHPLKARSATPGTTGLAEAAAGQSELARREHPRQNRAPPSRADHVQPEHRSPIRARRGRLCWGPGCHPYQTVLALRNGVRSARWRAQGSPFRTAFRTVGFSTGRGWVSVAELQGRRRPWSRRGRTVHDHRRLRPTPSRCARRGADGPSRAKRRSRCADTRICFWAAACSNTEWVSAPVQAQRGRTRHHGGSQ